MRNRLVLSILIQVSNLVSLICDSYVLEPTRTIYTLFSTIFVTIDYEMYDVTIEYNQNADVFNFNSLDDVGEIEVRGASILAQIRDVINLVGE